MAKLNLVKTDAGEYYLQGIADPTRGADFSLYDLDGEGGDPFRLSSGSQWEIVDGTPTVEYDPDDSDSFWAAQSEIVTAAIALGIPVPEYAR